MKFALIVYDDVTLLDFCGVYDPVSRLKTMGFLPELEYHVCAMNSPVRSFEGLEILPDQIGGSLSEYDYVFIPGGNGVAKLLSDKAFMGWVRSASTQAVLTAVCGGVLVLGALGFLAGKPATTHPNHMPYLERMAGNISKARVVDAGNVITAGGVTSAIDLGLYLCQRIDGTEAAEKIRIQMDYPASICSGHA